MSGLSETRVGRSGLDRWIALLLLLLPFGLFFWQLPFASDQTIGNDYTLFPTRHQQELTFSIRMGSFPLFVPGFSGGHTASALTLGQLFHPISWLASNSPGYWDGHALDWNTFYRILSLGLTHVVLFRLLVALGLARFLAVLLGGITVYNLRMLDLFRYGSSLESYTAFLVCCASILWCRLAPSRWLPRVGVVLSTYCLVTSGHPQMMYYGLLGAGLTVLVAPAYVKALRGEETADPRVLPFFLRTGLLLVGGLLLSSAYVAPFYFDFLGDNTQRIGRDYAWADGYRDSFLGTLNSFFLPLHSRVGGAFGGSSLFLAAALTPLLALFRVRLPAVVWGIWGLALLTFLHMQGERTPVHLLTWKYLPLAGSFRIAGRIAILLPYLFLLLLAWQCRAGKPRVSGRRAAPLALAAVMAAVLTAVYAVLPQALTRESIKWSPIYMSIPEWSHTVLLLSGIAALAAGAVFCKAKSASGVSRAAGLLFAVATLTQVGISLRYGTWIEAKTASPSFEELRQEKRGRLDFTGDPGVGLATSVVVEHLAHGAPKEPFLGKLFEDFVTVESTAEAYAVMAGGRDPHTVVLEGPIESSMDPETFSAGHVELGYASFNRLSFRVSSAKATFFGLGHPFSRHWKATVGGEEVSIQRANGGYQAVLVPPGETTVDFRYVSAAARGGMLVSSAVLSLLALLLVFGTLGGPARWVAGALALAAGPLLFTCWQRSLFEGDSLGTEYEWSAVPKPERRNLAYGRTAWIASLSEPEPRSITRGSGAVDGMHGRDTGALSRTGANPTWTVELAQPTILREVVVREGSRKFAATAKREAGKPFNKRPLILQTSLDGEEWINVAAARRPPTGKPLRLKLEGERPARFFRIVGQGTRLALDEVELYER